MPTDPTWFFEIFLGGFITVWTYRYFSASKEKYAEFEWLGLSAFWGLNIIGLISLLPDKAQNATLFSNPLNTAIVASTYGLILGYMGSRLVRMKWFRWILGYFGKGGEDKSGKLF